MAKNDKSQTKIPNSSNEASSSTPIKTETSNSTTHHTEECRPESSIVSNIAPAAFITCNKCTHDKPLGSSSHNSECSKHDNSAVVSNFAPAVSINCNKCDYEENSGSSIYCTESGKNGSIVSNIAPAVFITCDTCDFI